MNIKQILHEEFRRQQNNATDRISLFYNDFYSEIAKLSPEEWKTYVGRQESIELSETFNKIYQEVREGAIKAAESAGISKSDAVLHWSEAVNNIETPKPIIISYYDPTQNFDTPEQSSVSKTTAMPPNGIWITVAGVCCEILGWVFIKNVGWAAVVKGVGLVLLAAGAVVTYRKRKTLITPNEDFIEIQKKNNEEAIKSILNEQYENNSRLVIDWIDRMEAQYIDVCNKNEA